MRLPSVCFYTEIDSVDYFYRGDIYPRKAFLSCAFFHALQTIVI